MLSKPDLLRTLPCPHADFVLRPWTRPDVTLLAAWPSYPFPFHPLNLSCAHQPPAALDHYFASRDTDPHRISLIIDLPSQPAVGYLALLDLDFPARAARNLVVRLHPAHCNQGRGTAMLQLLTTWSTRAGIASLSLDVAAANQRAIRCYLKAGFSILSEFWRDETNLSPADLARPDYAFARPHTRLSGTSLQTRFYTMQFPATPP
jgi:RimJ/RimL family protein N-acetyltransferase